MFCTLLFLLALPGLAFAHQALTSLDDAGCLKCHESLTKQKVIHPAMEAGCSACHQGKSDGGKTTFALTAKGDALCFSCHSDKQELLKKKMVHPPFKEMGCTTCHNPHGSAVKKMLIAKVPDLCLNCHDDKKVDPKAATKHPPFVAGDCLTCHNPHATDQAKLLPKTVREVCMVCHKDQIRVQHPVPWHPIDKVPDPLHEGKELSCVSCHNPHQSNHVRLFYAQDNKMLLCVDCHSKIKGKGAIRAIR